MAFSLGLNIAQSELSLRSFIISNIMFSLASPVGVGIGIAMAGLPSSLPHDIANGVLQGKTIYFIIIILTLVSQVLLAEPSFT